MSEALLEGALEGTITSFCTINLLQKKKKKKGRRTGLMISNLPEKLEPLPSSSSLLSFCTSVRINLMR